MPDIDPAYAAAQRVMTGPPRTLYVDDLIAAAREALNAIIEWYEDPDRPFSELPGLIYPGP